MTRISDEVKLAMLLCILMAFVLFTEGCASKKQAQMQQMNELEHKIYASYAEVEPEKLKRQIDVANQKYDNGEHHDAILLYKDLLEEYRTEDKTLEVAINTNMALAALEMGDRDRFFQYAERARNLGGDLGYLTENTQLVFMLDQCFKGDCANRRDMRISVGIFDSVKNIIGEVR